MVVSLVPITRDFAGYQLLGDPKWLASSLDFGTLLQVCTQYCDHPWFDEAGVYQVTGNYSDNAFTGCVEPQYPSFGSEAPDGY